MALFKRLKKAFQPRELTPEQEAEQVIKEHYVKFSMGSTIPKSFKPFTIRDCADGYSLYDKKGEEYGFIFSKEELIKAIITSNYDWEKAFDWLIDFAMKRSKEYDIQSEVNKIEAREERRKIREEAEKRLYGKKKTIRIPLSEDEKEIVLSKFEHKCAVCNQNEGLHIHHKDHNPSNNQLGNLIVLCGVCHKKFHMKVR